LRLLLSVSAGSGLQDPAERGDCLGSNGYRAVVHGNADELPGRPRPLQACQGSNDRPAHVRRGVLEGLDQSFLDAGLGPDPRDSASADRGIRRCEGGPKLGEPERRGAAGIHGPEGRFRLCPTPLVEGSELGVLLLA
jgi:hypothetical protein